MSQAIIISLKYFCGLIIIKKKLKEKVIFIIVDLFVEC